MPTPGASGGPGSDRLLSPRRTLLSLAVGLAAPVESVLKMATELAEAREEREAATALASYIRPDDAAAGIGVGLNVGVKSSRSARASRAGHAQMITPAAV